MPAAIGWLIGVINADSSPDSRGFSHLPLPSGSLVLNYYLDFGVLGQ